MEKDVAQQRVRQGITFGQLRDCLIDALDVADGTPASLNSSLSKFDAWNIFHKAIKDRPDTDRADSMKDEMLATNILREFGDVWAINEELRENPL